MSFLLMMPSFNQSHYIADAVKSVLAQSDPDWALWIVDNSTDGTPDVMRAFDDPRIHFHHIPERMDPGSCLNWMLERAQGEVFSYVHTDNNLYPSYVARLRAALAGKPHGLAYCDMGAIDGQGASTGVFRRGDFDLARLFSLASLGVPFAATTALARAIGGFRPNDLADDVRFCISAFGVAEYVYVPELLLDYRAHTQSRATSSGWPRLRKALLDMCLELRPQIIARGAGDPLTALARAVSQRFAEIEQPFHRLWETRLSSVMRSWPDDCRPIDGLFQARLLRLPGFAGGPAHPSPFLARSADGRIAAWPWQSYRTWRERASVGTETWGLIQQHLIPGLMTWAHLSLNGRASPIGVPDASFRCLVTAHLLEQELGCRPVRLPGARFPRWLSWPRASGNEPRLSFEGGPTLEAPQP